MLYYKYDIKECINKDAIIIYGEYENKWSRPC